MTEERAVNELGEEEKQSVFIDPKTGEVSETKPAEAAGSQTPKEEEGEPTWEDKFKKLQSDKDKEVTEAKAETSRLKTAFGPYLKNIKEVDGVPVLDFSETAPPAPKEKIKEPDEDLWNLDTPAAVKQQLAFDKQQEEERRDADASEKAAKDADDEYKKMRGEKWGIAVTEYPQLLTEKGEINSEDALFQKAQKIMNDDPSICASASCDLMAIRLAAAELKIAKKEGTTPPEEKGASGEKPKDKDKSYVISGASGSGKGKSTPTGKLSDEEFAALTPDEQTEHMRKTVNLGE